MLRLVAALLALEAGTSSLEVKVEGVEGSKGSVRCYLFSSARSFPEPKAAVATVVRPAAHDVVCRFDAVADGTWAVNVIHDEDDDGALSTGFFGIPTERRGASNGAKGRFGPPAFSDAAFTVRGDAGRTLTITLHD